MARACADVAHADRHTDRRGHRQAVSYRCLILSRADAGIIVLFVVAVIFAVSARFRKRGDGGGRGGERGMDVGALAPTSKHGAYRRA